MKNCLGCKVILDDSNAYRRKTGRIDSYCKSCKSETGKTYYLDNLGRKKEYAARYFAQNPEECARKVRERRENFRTLVASLKSERPCYDCGQMFPPESMDFDHVLGKKSFDLANGYKHSWQKVREEIDKCQLVCACCHRVRTLARRKQQKEKVI